MRPLRILFIVPYVPSRLRPRPFHFLHGLVQRGHRVALLALATTPIELAHASALQALCERVEILHLPTLGSLRRCAVAFARRQPLQAAYCFSPVMNSLLHSTLAGRPPFDVLHIEHLRAAGYGLGAPTRPRVYDAVDCMSRLHAYAATGGSSWLTRTTARLELGPTQRLERLALRRFERVLVSSESDRRALLGLDGRRDDDDRGDRVRTLPNGVDLGYFSPRDEPREPATLVFVGRLAYHANLAGALALVEEIMPRVWARRPGARLVIVGADPPSALRRAAARAGERVTVTGLVADVRPFLARATVAVSPLPYAVGIQNKVLEAMAMATPVVASPAARAALAAVHGSDLLVAAAPEQFSAAVLSLLDDPAAAARVGAAGRRYVSAHHEWARMTERLERLYGEAIEATVAMRASS